jgi:hypothetical protein
VDTFATIAATARIYSGPATTPQRKEQVANRFTSTWFEQPPAERTPIYRQLVLPRVVNTKFQKSKRAEHIWCTISEFVAALDALNPWYSFSQVSIETPPKILQSL